MKKVLILLILAIVVPLIYLIITNYNNIPKLDENVKEKWSQVQNQYKRRADLIPNLVETVKAYMSHESEVLEKVTALRTSWASAKDINDKVKIDSILTARLSDFPKVEPAIKRGIKVKTQFVLPVIIKVEK